MHSNDSSYSGQIVQEMLAFIPPPDFSHKNEKATRVPVKNPFDYLEGSSSLEEFLEDFPSVSRERAVAVLEAAQERLEADAPAA